MEDSSYTKKLIVFNVKVLSSKFLMPSNVTEYHIYFKYLLSLFSLSIKQPYLFP